MLFSRPATGANCRCIVVEAGLGGSRLTAQASNWDAHLYRAARDACAETDRRLSARRRLLVESTYRFEHAGELV